MTVLMTGIGIQEKRYISNTHDSMILGYKYMNEFHISCFNMELIHI